MVEEELEDKYERFQRYFDLDFKAVEEAALGGSGISLSDYYTKAQSNAITNPLDARITALETGSGVNLSNYYTKGQTDTLLSGKSSTSHNHDSRYYTSTIIDSMLLSYASQNGLNALDVRVTALENGGGGGGDLSNYYTKTQVNTLLAGYTNTAGMQSLLDNKSDLTHNHDSRYYTKAESDTLLSGKAATSHNHDTAYYTKTQIDSTLGSYVTSSSLTSTLAGYSVTSHTHDDRYFTETEVNNLLASKVDSSVTDAIDTRIDTLESNRIVALTDSSTISVNAALGKHFRVTLGGNRTLANPTNLVDGDKLLFEVIQDGTGSRTLSLGNKYAFGADITSLTLSSTASKRDFIMGTYIQAADKVFITAIARGY